MTTRTRKLHAVGLSPATARGIRVADLEARIKVRDELLDAIAGHLRRGRDTSYLAKLLDEAIALVRANEHRLADFSAVADDIAAFAAMDLSRGKPPKPSPLWRDLAIRHLGVVGYLRTALGQRFRREGLDWSKRDWSEVLHETWQEFFGQLGPLEHAVLPVALERKHKSKKPLPWVLLSRRLEERACRLLFLGTRPQRDRQERFEDFRKSMTRQNLRAHPWIVRDSKS